MPEETGENPSSPQLGQAESRTEQQRQAMLLGIVSAIGYSAANLSLRGLSGNDGRFEWAVWVTAMKALPTFLLASYLVTRRVKKGERVFPTSKPVPALLVAALLMQFGGNLGFQVALVHIGLAINVPLVFAMIICAGAIFGRMFLGDSVSQRTLIAIGVMGFAVALLSCAAANNEEPKSNVEVVVWFGILMSVVSGLSYGINGVVIRGVCRNLIPIESMMLVFSSTGVLLLGTWGFVGLKLSGLRSIEFSEWAMMLLAGFFNAIAFFSLTNALKRMNISQVNVINASQNGMCAMAAVVLFGEEASGYLIAGIILSIAGLFVLDRK